VDEMAQNEFSRRGPKDRESTNTLNMNENAIQQ